MKTLITKKNEDNGKKQKRKQRKKKEEKNCDNSCKIQRFFALIALELYVVW